MITEQISLQILLNETYDLSFDSLFWNKDDKMDIIMVVSVNIRICTVYTKAANCYAVGGLSSYCCFRQETHASRKFSKQKALRAA